MFILQRRKAKRAGLSVNRRGWIGGGLLLALCLAARAVSAQSLTLSARPDPAVTASRNAAYFDYLVAPGARFSDAVLLANVGSEPLTLVLYAADGVTASNGGIAFPTGQADSPQRAGAWLSLALRELTLPAGASRSVGFSVIVPDGVTAQQAAGIVVQLAVAPTASSGQFGVAVVQRTAVTVLFSLSNPPQADLAILGLAGEDRPEQTVVAQLLNRGTVGLRPAGSVTLTPLGNQAAVQEIPVRLGFFLPGDQIALRLAIDPPLPAGSYSAVLRLNYEGGVAQQAGTLTFVEPTAGEGGLALPAPGEARSQAGAVDSAADAQLQPASAAPNSAQPTPAAPAWALLAAAGLIVVLAGVVVWQARRLRRGGG